MYAVCIINISMYAVCFISIDTPPLTHTVLDENHSQLGDIWQYATLF